MYINEIVLCTMKSSQARMKSSAFASDEIKSASPNPTKSDFIAKRFHPTQVGFLPPSADLVEKSTHCLGIQMCAFFWSRRRESRFWQRAPTNDYQSFVLPLNTSVNVGFRANKSLPRFSPPSTLVEIRYISKKKNAPPWVRLSFWSRRRESNSPGTAWEAAAIPLGDTCIVPILYLFSKKLSTLFYPFFLFCGKILKQRFRPLIAYLPRCFVCIYP